MILTPDDLQELDSALNCLYNNGLADGIWASCKEVIRSIL